MIQRESVYNLSCQKASYTTCIFRNSDKVMIKDNSINKMRAINVETLIYNIRYIYSREWEKCTDLENTEIYEENNYN